MTTKSPKLERKLYLQKRALQHVKEFNNSYDSLVKLLSESKTITPETISTLVYLTNMLKIRSRLADTSHNRYIEYCDNNNYKRIDIEYATPYLFHDED